LSVHKNKVKSYVDRRYTSRCVDTGHPVLSKQLPGGCWLTEQVLRSGSCGVLL